MKMGCWEWLVKMALGSNCWPVLSEVRMETVCEDFRSMLVEDHCQLRDFLKVAHDFFHGQTCKDIPGLCMLLPAQPRPY